MATAINALGASDAAAVRAYTIASNAVNGETVLLPDTTDATAKYGVAVDWVIETGYTDFAGQTYADPVMCVGYNVAVGGRKDSGEISVGMFFEADYYLSGTRYSEAYISTRGGSTDSHNRPLFFQWNRVTGVLTTAQAHAAGAGGSVGFKIISPTGSAGEAGDQLWNLQANNLTGYSFPTSSDCNLVLGEGGASNAKGVISVKRNNAVSFSLYPISANSMAISLNGTEAYYFQKGASSTGWSLGIGSSTNSAQIYQDMAASPNAQIGHKILQKSTGTGNLLELATSGDVAKFQVTAAYNVVIGSAALATNATDGFLYIPTMAGAPTGNSTDYSGRLPIVFDTTNSKLWVNTTGTTWVGVALA